jgi:hypothetical protein
MAPAAPMPKIMPDDGRIGSFEVPVFRIGRRGPEGVLVDLLDARIGVHHVSITSTLTEVHFRVMGREECFALDYQAVVQAALKLVEADGIRRGYRK